MRITLGGSLLIVATVLVPFLLLELTLRVFPDLVPLPLLVHFQEDLRSDIANRLGLKRIQDTREVSRTDGGPPLVVFHPGITIRDHSKDAGAVDMVTDENGFCNKLGVYTKDTISVLTVGDSFTWCTGVRAEDTWSAKLGQQLGTDVYNLGLPGQGLYEYLELLRAYGLPKSPDVVVMAVYEGNDLRDALRYTDFITKGSIIVDTPYGACGNTGVLCDGYLFLKNSFLGKHSYVFALGLESVRWMRGFLLSSLSDADEEVNFRYEVARGDARIALNIENADLDEVAHARLLALNPKSVDALTGALEAFASLGSTHSFRPVVVYIPSAYTAYAPDVSFEDDALAPVMETFSSTQRTFYKSETERLGLDFVDATPFLQRAAKGVFSEDTLVYFPRSVHLTSHGHSVVAEAVTGILKPPSR